MASGLPGGSGGRGPIPLLPTFPLAIHSSGRYFIDARSIPFFIIGDSAQTITSRLSLAQVANYLDVRKAQGFNAVLLELCSHQLGVSGCPASFLGDQPFLKNVSGTTYTGANGTADFSTPNGACFDYVDAILDLIATRNMQVLAYTFNAFGFNLDGSQGWWKDMMLSANTRSVHTAFGNYLGARFSTAKRPNLWWLHGSDSFGNTTGTPESGIARAHALMLGMIAGGATQLRCFDGAAPSEASDGPIDATAGVSFADYIQIQGTYTAGGVFGNGIDGNGETISPTFNGQTFKEARRGWQFVPTATTQGPSGVVPSALPCFGKEFNYRSSPFAPGSRSDIRNAQMWAVLSGCTNGFFYGYDNSVAGHGVWNFATNWATDVLDASALDVGRFAAFIAGFAWWKLVPSEQPQIGSSRRLIPSSNGTQSVGGSYVAAAMANDGSFLLGYVPTNGSGAQTFTVDTRGLSGTTLCCWWDPTNGTFQTASPSTVSNTQSAQSFTTPGANSSGDNDWVIVLSTSGISKSGQFYSTNFPLAESPISENNKWSDTARLANRTHVVTASNVAHGTSVGGGSFSDSYAILSGNGSFTPNQRAVATIHFAAGSYGTFCEVALDLRMGETGAGPKGIECFISGFGQYASIALWNPARPNGFDYLVSGSSFTPIPADGDTLMAQVVGNVVSLYLNGTLLVTGDLSTFSAYSIGTLYDTGNPGISFDEDINDAGYGLKSYMAMSI